MKVSCSGDSWWLRGGATAGVAAFCAGLALQFAPATRAATPSAGETNQLAPKFFGGNRPLQVAELEQADLEVDSSAGLFVGVNEFESDPGLPKLEFAVDDAVALAHAFVVELKVIPPGQATLALGGAPRTAQGQARLAALKSIRVKITSAERAKILTEIIGVTGRATDPRGLIVLSFSTHGFEKEGGVYVMPQDGLRELFWDTGVALNTVKDRLRQAKPNKKLLIYDACRREPTRGSIGMSDAHRNALASAEGFGILASCGTGEVSWEDASLQHGVFTYFLLEGLRGAAPADESDGFLRLESVANYAARSTITWVNEKKHEKQEPWKELSAHAPRIPLAVNTNILGRIAAATQAEADRVRMAAEAAQALQERREKAQDTLSKAQRGQRTVFQLGTKQEVEAVIERLAGADLTNLLEHIEVMQDTNRVHVEGFLAWWRQEGFKLGGTSSPSLAGAWAARYTNSLGLVFVAVAGLQVKFSIWETRVRDFRAFVEAAGYDGRGGFLCLTANEWVDASKWVDQGVSWLQPGFTQTDNHAVCGTSWNDARAFCQWLTEKEHNEGRIGAQASYRLPRDAEWSVVVGTDLYPWGMQWPPPQNVANLAEEEARDANWPGDYRVIPDFQDGYPRTSPVGTFSPNKLGIYDLSGNVSEWCEDWYRKELNTPETRSALRVLDSDGGGQVYRVLRGGSWVDDTPTEISSAIRYFEAPDLRSTDTGFRCVLEDRAELKSEGQ